MSEKKTRTSSARSKKKTMTAEAAPEPQILEAAPEVIPEIRPMAPMPTTPTTVPNASNVRAFAKDHYVIQTVFEKNLNTFVATVLEIPSLRTEGNTRQEALKLMDEELTLHIEQSRKNGESVPEACMDKHYPAKLEVSVSQSLFRKLDSLSKVEKISLDQLVTELLSTGAEKRFGYNRNRNDFRNNDQKRFQGGGNQGRHENHGNQSHPNRHENQGQRGGQNRRPHNKMSGRRYQPNIESGENFLEYVRNLEKRNK